MSESPGAALGAECRRCKKPVSSQELSKQTLRGRVYCQRHFERKLKELEAASAEEPAAKDRDKKEKEKKSKKDKAKDSSSSKDKKKKDRRPELEQGEEEPAQQEEAKDKKKSRRKPKEEAAAEAGEKKDKRKKSKQLTDSFEEVSQALSDFPASSQGSPSSAKVSSSASATIALQSQQSQQQLPRQPSNPGGDENVVIAADEICIICNLAITAEQELMGISDTELLHTHCLACSVCKVSLVDALFINEGATLYCQTHWQERNCHPCDACGQVITEGEFIHRWGRYWHEDHFGCSVCKEPFRGQPHYEREEQAYCKQHFGERFATRCSGCGDPIMEEAIVQNLDDVVVEDGDDDDEGADGSLRRQVTGQHSQKQPAKQKTPSAAADDSSDDNVLHFHRKCFVCVLGEPLDPDRPFYMHDGHKYCATHYEDLILPQCWECGLTIIGKYVRGGDPPEDFHKECWEGRRDRGQKVSSGQILPVDGVFPSNKPLDLAAELASLNPVSAEAAAASAGSSGSADAADQPQLRRARQASRALERPEGLPSAAEVKAAAAAAAASPASPKGSGNRGPSLSSSASSEQIHEAHVRALVRSLPRVESAEAELRSQARRCPKCRGMTPDPVECDRCGHSISRRNTVSQFEPPPPGLFEEDEDEDRDGEEVEAGIPPPSAASEAESTSSSAKKDKKTKKEKKEKKEKKSRKDGSEKEQAEAASELPKKKKKKDSDESSGQDEKRSKKKTKDGSEETAAPDKSSKKRKKDTSESSSSSKKSKKGDYDVEEESSPEKPKKRSKDKERGSKKEDSGKDKDKEPSKADKKHKKHKSVSYSSSSTFPSSPGPPSPYSRSTGSPPGSPRSPKAKRQWLTTAEVQQIRERYCINAAEYVGQNISSPTSSSGAGAGFGGETDEGLRALTLRDVLGVPHYCAALATFMRRNLTLENLTFLQHVEGFQALFRPDSELGRRLGDEGRLERARRIWSVYMSENATRMINVDSANSEQARQLIAFWSGKNQSDEHIFDRCYMEIFDLTARDVFSRFLRSPDYKAMLSHPMPMVQLEAKLKRTFSFSICRTEESYSFLDFIVDRIVSSKAGRTQRLFLWQYKHVFTGSQLVDWLLQQGFAETGIPSTAAFHSSAARQPLVRRTGGATGKHRTNAAASTTGDRQVATSIGQRLLEAGMLRPMAASSSSQQEWLGFEDNGNSYQVIHYGKVGRNWPGASALINQEHAMYGTLVLKGVRHSRVWAVVSSGTQKLFCWRQNDARQPHSVINLKDSKIVLHQTVCQNGEDHPDLRTAYFQVFTDHGEVVILLEDTNTLLSWIAAFQRMGCVVSMKQWMEG